MRETEKGYMSDDGVEFRSYIECQQHEAYVDKGLIWSGYGSKDDTMYNNLCRIHETNPFYFYH